MIIGPWTVTPSQNAIERDGVQVRLEPRAMDLLVYLAATAGRVVSADELLREVWRGRVFDDGVVYKKINQLRKALGDDPHRPRFIETIPKRGYRLIASVVGTSGGEATSAGRSARVAPAADVAAPPPVRLRPIAKGAAFAAMFAVLVVVAMSNVTPQAESERLSFSSLSLQRDGSEWFDASSIVWSPDGRAIALSIGNAGAGGSAFPQTYLRALGSPALIPVASLPSGSWPMTWTPRGQELLLHTSAANLRNAAGLWTVPAGGDQPEPLLDLPPDTLRDMSVNRDGTALAVLHLEDGVWGVWTATLPDGRLERYEPAPFAGPSLINRPALSFSPDGRQLLLMWNTALEEQAWLMPYPPDAARPPQRVLQSLPRAVTPRFSWLPDNRHIVVSAGDYLRPARLYLADTISGRFRPLTDTPGTAHQLAPVVAPDGRRLLFTEYTPDLDIVTLDLGTTAVEPVIATSRIDQMPSWSADGSALVYVAYRDDRGEIWLRDAEGDRPIVTGRDFEAGPNTSHFMAPTLSPDAGRVIYSRVEIASRTGPAAINLWLSSVIGGAPVRLTDRPSFIVEGAGSWSPDGRWYVYSELSAEGFPRIKRVRTTGGATPETLVERAARSPIVPVWSPDGQWILYSDDELKLISLDTRETRELGVREGICAFAPAEPVLYCIPFLLGPGGLTVVDFNGTAREVGPVPLRDRPSAASGPAMRVSLSPDGRGITYSVDRSRFELLLADGLETVALP